MGSDDESRLTALLGGLVRKRGRRVLTRVLAQVIGAPPTTVTPRLRAALHTRDHGRCVVPGCRNFRFVDLHHHQPRAAGGPHTLENVMTLCTQHHRLVHEGVLAIEGSPKRGLVVRHAGGTLYGASMVR